MLIYFERGALRVIPLYRGNGLLFGTYGIVLTETTLYLFVMTELHTCGFRIFQFCLPRVHGWLKGPGPVRYPCLAKMLPLRRNGLFEACYLADAGCFS